MDRAELIAAFAAITNPAPRPLNLPEFPGACARVQTTGGQSETVEALRQFDGKDGRGNARTLAMILCDADGNLIFNINDPAHVEILNGLPAQVSNLIFRVSNEANNVKVEDADKPGEA